MDATATPQRLRRIGEVADAAGLTVRTLRHYDELGLLVPTERTGAGYRLYNDDDMARLYRILALRRLGFPLEEIRASLSREGEDPRPAVRRHLGRLEEQLLLTEQLRTRLKRILEVLERSDEPSGDLFIEVIEVMTRMERYYTPKQLEQLERRRHELGEDEIERVQDEWAELIAEFDRHRAAGTDPAAPEVQALTRRSSELLKMFTGGDPGIAESLERVWQEEGAARASRGMVSEEVAEYMHRAHAARSGRCDKPLDGR
jgi:MerR family transcriptional regulator, thiopeptide resistance regulator